MLVDIGPTTRLRGDEPVDVPRAVKPVVRALNEDSVQLDRVRLVCDWVQYRNNFRAPVDLRPILGSSGIEAVEVAMDLRRRGDAAAEADAALASAARTALAAEESPQADGRVYLEPWVAGSRSVIWDFNAMYWRDLSLWESVTGKAYEQALPGGQSDAHNVAAACQLIGQLLTVWDRLDARGALPETLYVVEIGVGNGNQARTWLDEFRMMDRERGTDYYSRLHYLMCDYSPQVLELARGAVAEHAGHVSSLVVDATRPMTALSFLRSQALLVYVSNVYDNLPTDEIARIDGRTYRVECRAYLPEDAVERLAKAVSTTAGALPALVGKLLRLGPELLAEALPDNLVDAWSCVEFWQKCWRELHLEDRYVPLDDPGIEPLAPGIACEELLPLLDAYDDVRMQVSTGAVTSFADTLPLLHPSGRLHCHDLFVTDSASYTKAFCGPGKYDGSVVNWVNGAVLEQIGATRGYQVTYQPFTHRPGTNLSTLTATARV